MKKLCVVFLVFLSMPAWAQEKKVEQLEATALKQELTKTQAQRQEALTLANVALQKSLDALKDTPEYKAYEAAIKVVEALRGK